MATTLTVAASPTSVLYGGTVQLTGRLQQTTTAEGIAGETLTLERRPKRTTSWTTLATVTTASDGTLDPTQTKASDTDHIGAISQSFRLVVYRAAITGITPTPPVTTAVTATASTRWSANTGAAAINLAGWKLHAGDRSQRFTLTSYVLKKGATVRIHTGRGTTRAGHLYLGSGRPIWNNDGDTATLIDPHNIVASRYRY